MGNMSWHQAKPPLGYFILAHTSNRACVRMHSLFGRQVRPAPGRLVLMDADITHRISPPSPLAQQPR